ncbi:MAG TPA: ATP-binding protein [Gemmatimonadales bacterium]|nr:ATP-binding protein [Gemmatimonadales bacterium]
MSRAFRDRPIRQKVNLLIAAASGMALVLAAVGLIVYDVTTVRPRGLRDLMAQVELIRINTMAAMAFQDQEAATENLGTLRAKREIASAALFGPDGRLFASYVRPGEAAVPRNARPPAAGHTYQNNRLTISERVQNEGQALGWITMEYTLPPLWSRLPQYGIITGVVLLALLTVSLLLWRLLESSITEPLARLAEASKAVAQSRTRQARPVKPADDEIGHLTDAFNDMLSTLEHRESALRESTAQLLEAMTVARMGSWAWDVHESTLSWGGREAEVFGPRGKPADASLRSFLDLVHPSDRAAVEHGLSRAAETGQRCELDFRVLDPDGHTRWLALKGQRVHEDGRGSSKLVGLVMDMTDRRRLEEQLLQSQKLEAIGRLAGGVAHDFNNLLTGILGYANFALKSLPENHASRPDILEIERAGTRAAALTGQLLAYARRQMIAPKIVSLNELVTNMESLLRRLIGEDVDLETRCAPQLWPAQIDPGQFEQVIINLAVNARDAMPSGGRLTIETSNCTLDDTYVSQHPEVVPGEYVMLAVADTGIGMDSATQVRIFEPFFTTKEQGKGTGLGLAVCYGIVRQANGHLWVYSERGRGTTFKVLLPRTLEEGEAAAMPKPPEQLSSQGRETVLVVEDEPVVRRLTVRALTERGYHVLEAEDGESALSVAREHQGDLQLLVTDVVMPGMNGKELADRLAADRPDLRVLYISGYAEHAVVRQGVLVEGIAFLSKPFDLSELARTVREVLDKVQAPG